MLKLVDYVAFEPDKNDTENECKITTRRAICMLYREAEMSALL